MRIERLIVGQLKTNCYLVWEEKTSEAIVVDPGDDGDYIIQKIQDFKLSPKLIIATHGHFDHLLAVLELKLAFSIPFLMHKNDLFLLKRARETAKHFLGVKADPPAKPDRFVKENDLISFGREKLVVLETPGHTPGGISLSGKGLLFTGDTLFAESLGRTDFSYSSKGKLEESLKKLFKLPAKTAVYPGHGEETTIEKAKILTIP